MGISLKKLDLENIDKAIALRIKLWKEAGKIEDNQESEGMYEINYTYFYTHMLDDKLVFYYCQDDDNCEIIATGAGLIVETPPVNYNNLGIQGHIFNIWTKEEYRHQGYATKILNTIIDDLKSKDVTKFNLGANEISYKLYDKNGFINNKYYLEKSI